MKSSASWFIFWEWSGLAGCTGTAALPNLLVLQMVVQQVVRSNGLVTRNSSPFLPPWKTKLFFQGDADATQCGKATLQLEKALRDSGKVRLYSLTPSIGTNVLLLPAGIYFLSFLLLPKNKVVMSV